MLKRRTQSGKADVEQEGRRAELGLLWSKGPEEKLGDVAGG